MGSDDETKFDAVTIGEHWGIVDAAGFHQSESHRYAAPGAYPFTVCSIDGRQVAVLIEATISVANHAELASRKPDWLDAIVDAKVISDPRAEVAVIQTHLLTPDDVTLHMCAFASACVAFDHGSFEVTPKSYLVRFGTGASVRIRMEFDDAAESWLGKAANEPSSLDEGNR